MVSKSLPNVEVYGPGGTLLGRADVLLRFDPDGRIWGSLQFREREPSAPPVHPVITIDVGPLDFGDAPLGVSFPTDEELITQTALIRFRVMAQVVDDCLIECPSPEAD